MKISKIIVLLVIISLVTTLGIGFIGCKQEAAETTAAEATAAETTAAETTAAETTAAEATEPAGQEDTPMGEGVIYYFLPEMFGVIQPLFANQNEKYGSELGYEVRTLAANNQATEQIRQLDDAIAQSPAAMILNAVDSATVTASVDKARSEGIPVMVLDRFIVDTKVDFTSAIGVIKLGQMGAAQSLELLKEKYGEEKGVILEVMGDIGDNYSVLIDQGFQEVMKDYPNIELIVKDTPGWETTNTVNLVTDQVTARDDIDIIFIHWDGRVPWIFPVLESQGYGPGDIKIIGTDGEPEALQLIKDGWIDATITYPVFSEVYGNWMFIDEILANEEIVPGVYNVLGEDCDVVIEEWGPTLYVPGVIVTKDNVDDPALWANNAPAE